MIDYTLTGNPKTYFHTDRLGSVIAMSDASGNVVEGPYTYDPSGKGAPTTGVPFKFTGRRLDSETGLYYYRARYYSANTGRFFQTDLVGYDNEMNLYTYVSNDSVNLTDHSGLRAYVYVSPMPKGQQGYSFYAVDDQTEGPVVGHFNVTTSNSVVLPIGDYSLSPRPHVRVKTGVAGLLQSLNQIASGNAMGDPNRHEGDPTLSNITDWNTIRLPDGGTMQGVMIHPGRDPETGEGGASLSCLVCNNVDFGELNKMLSQNYNKGGAYLHMDDFGYFNPIIPQDYDVPEIHLK